MDGKLLDTQQFVELPFIATCHAKSMPEENLRPFAVVMLRAKFSVKRSGGGA